ncbi:hypothetical protein KUV23_00460 [Algoriphagus marincola]|uniref:Lipoprotein n=1 Tax=Algoriphagus marincola TaxID=264027 RepID=A0ABS7MZC0_9BACT|nr:hypothetical protein [Algoriphagus marincola]MBY5949419.1 hypothetical protein [Algoriphagus marincola]
MNLKITTFLSFCLGLFACSYDPCKKVVHDFDLNQPYEQKMDFSNCNLGYVHYQNIRISGELEGTAFVGVFFKIEGKGHYDTLIRSDYYSDSYTFRYEPSGEVTGDLQFEVWLE